MGIEWDRAMGMDHTDVSHMNVMNSKSIPFYHILPIIIHQEKLLVGSF